MALRILVIEDTPDAVLLIKTALGKDYVIDIAQDLVQARGALLKVLPDIILLDASLPDGDGFSFCTWLKNNQKVKDVPVIFLTSRSDPEERDFALSKGAFDYLTKPIKPKELKAKIKACTDALARLSQPA